MPRYIDAEPLYERTAEWEASALSKIEELNRIPLEEMTDEEIAEWRRWTAILGERTAFKHDVADAPTADVVERKKGRWENICSLQNWQYTYEHYRCSNCGIPAECAFRYCPNCGAKMEQ